METTSNIPSDAELSIEETITDLEEAMEAEVAAAIAATQEHAATSPELSPPLSIDPAEVASAGFEPTLRATLEKARGTLLFIMPGRAGEKSVAAVSVEKGETRDTLLAIMESDDGVVRLESANGSSHPVAGLALSWTRVMERMPAIAA